MKKRVVVGLSGGVDSSVTAKILLDQGYEVIGVFMKNWDDTQDAECPAAVDAMDARSVANQLGIPFYSLNFSKEYWDDVFSYFLSEHKQYRTPNPDILCNKFIKFKVFLKAAEDLGADFLATGHYARNFFNTETDQFELRCPVDHSKDQTYFLHTLGQDQLKKVLFPLADLPKSEIRKMAQEAQFENANKKDSTGICFVGERDYMAFLKKYLHQEPGEIITESGQVVGTHIGLSFYTIGQRKNLNIGGVKGYPELPWFVLEKDLAKNQLIICQDSENPKLFKKELVAQNLSWVSGEFPKNKICKAKIRYRQESQACEIEQEGNQVKAIFKEPQRAITPGQSIVFYDHTDTACLGGGEIM